LGSVSPSPYKVARRKSPREPRAAPNNSITDLKAQRYFQVTSVGGFYNAARQAVENISARRALVNKPARLAKGSRPR